jgi:hypothetical protein
MSVKVPGPGCTESADTDARRSTRTEMRKTNFMRKTVDFEKKILTTDPKGKTD